MHGDYIVYIFKNLTILVRSRAYGLFTLKGQCNEIFDTLFSKDFYLHGPHLNIEQSKTTRPTRMVQYFTLKNKNKKVTIY